MSVVPLLIQLIGENTHTLSWAGVLYAPRGQINLVCTSLCLKLERAPLRVSTRGCVQSRSSQAPRTHWRMKVQVPTCRLGGGGSEIVELGSLNTPPMLSAY